MSRIAFFKNALAQTALDASQSQLIQTIQGQYTTLSTDVSAKASAQSVTDLTSIVASKANLSALNTLSDNVALKANSNVVATLQTLVDSKASELSVAAVSDAVALKASASTVSTLTNVVNTKVAQSIFDARINNEAVFYEAVSASIHFQTASGVELDYVTLGLLPPA